MKKSMARALLLAFAAVLVPACGGSSSKGGSGGGLSRTSNGGDGVGAGTNTDAGAGGATTIHSTGNVFIGVNSPPQSPTLPPVPASTASQPSWTGAANNAATVVEIGSVTASPTAGAASITATQGDIVVSGNLVVGDNGTSETDLSILAPNGTVWVTGSIRSGKTDATADGDDAGDIIIRAKRIIVIGTIDASAESGGILGGDGGAIILDTDTDNGTDVLVIGGTLISNGGDGSGAASAGGNGGAITLDAENQVRVHSTLTSVGGSASGTGLVGSATTGNSGGVLIEGPAGVSLDSSIDTHAGNATSSDSAADPGAGGTVDINTLAAASGPVAVYGSIVSSGGVSSGDGAAAQVGGNGGALLIGSVGVGPSTVDLGAGSFVARGGFASTSQGGSGADFTINNPGFGSAFVRGSSFDLSDGDSGDGSVSAAAGLFRITLDHGDISLANVTVTSGGGAGGGPIRGSAGGTVTLQAGDGGATDAGNIIVQDSAFILNGGHQTAGNTNAFPTGPVARGGGAVNAIANNPTGSVTFSGVGIEMNGGNASGTGTGNAGGNVLIQTTGGGGGPTGGNVSFLGSVTGNGGSGDIAGNGGNFTVQSDTNADGTGGDITIQSGTSVSLVGGAGVVTGGNSVAAVHLLLDSDGNDGSVFATNGRIINNGSFNLNGNGLNGIGGSVTFDGSNAAGAAAPVLGTVTVAGSGTGANGAILLQ